MLTICYGTQHQSRTQVVEFIQFNKKLNSNYKVIDVGGATVGWSKPYVDMIVDISAPNSESSMSFDISDESNWTALLNSVEENGLYDFSICTHTLEDIYNPVTALKLLPKISKAGIITMPNIKIELSRVESEEWIGYIHHRWMFDRIDDVMHIVPKLSVLESLVKHKSIKCDQEQTEVQFLWSNDIPYKLFMNGYLGPNVQTVLDNYSKLIGGLV
jgi:hypothetical protein